MDTSFILTLFSRQVVVASGILAALLVVLGSAASMRQVEKKVRFPGMLIKIGYVLFFVSVSVFIIAGFLNR